MSEACQDAEEVPVAVQTSAADVAAVVVSHDRSADIWPGFFALLSRFWADLPYPVYLISNHLTFPDRRVTTLCVGDDLSWSDTLARGLERIPSRYVLLILDDFFLTAPVDTALVRRMQDAIVSKGAAYLRLVPNPAADMPCPDLPTIGTISKGEPYRASLQMAFWLRSALMSLLRQEESAWDFEIKGSRRSDAMSETFLGVCDGPPIVPYRHVLRRGKVLPDAACFFAPLGVSFDLSKRRLESRLNLRWQASAARRHLGKAWRAIMGRSL